MSFVLGVLVVALLVIPSAFAAAPSAPDEHKVALCHATDSQTNPYVYIDVDYHSITKSGHGEHTGPIWHPGIVGKWGDIIPPFDFGGDAVFPGLNWTAEGQALLDAGCQVAPATTTTTAPSSTTTTAPSTTTTEAPGSTTTTAPAEHKVALCHATDSQTNPYVYIDVDYHSIIKSGHGDHTGPIWHPGIVGKWGDIIPPFDFGGDAVFPGLNWTAEGQALLAAGCQVPPATTTTTAPATTTTTMPETTTTAPATTTTTMPETTTTAPETTTTTTPETTTTAPETTTTTTPESTTTTTMPESTTTTTPESTTTTMAPGSTTTTTPESTTTTTPESTTTTTPESTTTTTVAESTTTTTGVIGVLPESTVTSRPAGVAPASTTPAQVLGESQTQPVTAALPATGAATDLLLRLALVLLLGGGAMVVLAHRRTERS